MISKMNLKRIYIRDAGGRYTTVTPEWIVATAENILRERVVSGEPLTDPAATRRWLITRLSDRPHEIFCVLYLDNRHRVIAFEELFRGTIDGASVHPREVVKQALQHNAAAVIFAHNHPSGVSEPSDADRRLTQRLREALALVDIRTLDHFVIGGVEAVSFAERGLL
jgi:DNA repair protein RadC